MKKNLSEKIERKFIESVDVSDWEIETDKGWANISAIHKTVEYQEWFIETISGLTLRCADTHILFNENYEEVFAKDLVPFTSKIITKYGSDLIINAKPTGKSDNMYDVTVDSKDHRFWSNDILSHNTTTAAGYLLWSVLFQPNYSIAILANKGSLAREILDRIKYSYEFLPKFIQQGCMVWNRGNIVLENGSKIFAYATSSTGVRGGSFNCVHGDTLIEVDFGGIILPITINDLYNRLDGSYNYAYNQTYRVKTISGYKAFKGIKKSDFYKNTIKVILNDGKYLICTPEHKLQTTNGWIEAEHAVGLDVRIEGGYSKCVSNAQYGVYSVFDLIDVEDTSSFLGNGISAHNCIFLDEFAFVQHSLAEDFFRATYPVISSGMSTKVIIVSTPNGLNMFYKMWVDATEKRSLYIPYEIHWSQVPGRDQKWMEETIRNTSEEAFEVEYNCEFIGSTATLVSGSKLRSLAFRKPILSEDAFDIYYQPEKDHQYVCVVDCSEGVQQDYSTVSVIDVTKTPYVQVAKYRDNKTPLLFLPNTIYSIAKKYNEAFVLVETNNIGQQVIDILHYELEYENIYKVDQHHIKGQAISAGYKRNSSIGIRTTKTVKKIGCANLKTLIETDQLILYDFDTIAELNSFIRVRDSYAAEDGAHDDLVMGLVLFSWLTAQTYFKDATNTDIRKFLIEEYNIGMDESLTPVGFIDNGLGDDHYYDGTDVWYFSLPDT